MKAKKTATIVLYDIKDPDGWQELLTKLGLIDTDEEGVNRAPKAAQKLVQKHFDCGEYASLELEIDEDLNVVGGRIL